LRFTELRHCAHPGGLEQRDRAGQSGPQPDPQDYTLDAEGYVALAVSSGRRANSSFNITL